MITYIKVILLLIVPFSVYSQNEYIVSGIVSLSDQDMPNITQEARITIRGVDVFQFIDINNDGTFSGTIISTDSAFFVDAYVFGYERIEGIPKSGNGLGNLVDILLTRAATRRVDMIQIQGYILDKCTHIKTHTIQNSLGTDSRPITKSGYYLLELPLSTYQKAKELGTNSFKLDFLYTIVKDNKEDNKSKDVRLEENRTVYYEDFYICDHSLLYEGRLYEEVYDSLSNSIVKKFLSNYKVDCIINGQSAITDGSGYFEIFLPDRNGENKTFFTTSLKISNNNNVIDRITVTYPNPENINEHRIIVH